MRATLGKALLATLALAAGGLEAQEVQVPVDEAGRIQVITAELARRLGLFGEVDGFREARLFQLPDGTFLLEITSGRGNQLRRDRRPLSAADATAFRSDLTARVTARAPTAVLDQSGRVKLLVGTMILGLGFYGPATAAAFDPKDDQTAVAIYMLTAAGSFFVPFLTTRAMAVPTAAADMALWGASRGPIHGYLVSELGDAEQDKTKFAWSVFIGATEAIVGGVAGRGLGITRGRAELTGAGGDIGLGVGFAAANLLKLDQPDSVTVSYPGQPSYTYPVYDRTRQSAAMLIGSGLGLVGGYLLGGTEEWTRGDAMIFRNATGIGALAGLAAGDLIHTPRVITTPPDPVTGFSYSYYEDDFSHPHSAGGLIGAAAGAVLGRALVTGRNFTTSQGTLLTLSSLAGGLLGLGIAYVSTSEQDYSYCPAPGPCRDPNDHSELYLTASAIGAGAGFAALYPAMALQARGTTVEPNLQLSVNPLAAAQLLGRNRGQVPLASISLRF